MKKSAGVLLGVSGAAIVAAAVVCKNYDEWFTFPPLRKIVSAQLKDPASAQFRDERISRLGWLCGELNTKNGMGGYAGFKRYIASASGEACLEGDGYVGSLKDPTAIHDRMLWEIKARTEVMRQFVRQAEMGLRTNEPSEQEFMEALNREMFAEKWRQVCDSV